MKVREAIYTRRTIRKFRPEPISDDVLRELVEAARFAPSASNMQPLKYKLIGSADAARVFPHVHWAGAIRPAGDPKPGEEPTAYILILADTDIRKAGYEMDVGIAAESMTLAAMEMGLGSCMMGAIDREAIKKEFDIPEHLALPLVLALGYPAQKPVAVEMADPAKYSYWLTEEGVLTVPKRPLDEIIV